MIPCTQLVLDREIDVEARLVAALLAFSVLAGTAASASADYSVGPPTTWHPVDPSSSPH
jgi:hypothetical protein